MPSSCSSEPREASGACCSQGDLQWITLTFLQGQFLLSFHLFLNIHFLQQIDNKRQPEVFPKHNASVHLNRENKTLQS